MFDIILRIITTPGMSIFEKRAILKTMRDNLNKPEAIAMATQYIKMYDNLITELQNSNMLDVTPIVPQLLPEKGKQ